MAYTEREAKDSFDKVSAIYDAVAVIGPRQAGKTTFLKERIKGLNSSYVLFDDPDARALFESDIKKFETQYVEGHDVTVLDEVQYCRDAGAKLKYLIDKGRRLWITSSSATVLGKEILSYLVGRISIIRLFPFSLPEFTASKGQKETTPQILERLAWEHMTYGGYPKVVTTEDIDMKETILRDLHETMLLKDVARTFSIDDLQALEKFAKYLSVNVGGILSYENATRDVGISFKTLKKYLAAMEKSYLIVNVPPFHTNKSKEIAKRPKIYYVDTGLRNSVVKDFDIAPSGPLFENYVLSELMKLGFEPKYWRTKSKSEVDFVVEPGNTVIPIEVKLNASGGIERSLHSFIDFYKPRLALVVGYAGTQGPVRNVNGCTVVFTDVLGMRKWLGK